MKFWFFLGFFFTFLFGIIYTIPMSRLIHDEMDLTEAKNNTYIEQILNSTHNPRSKY
ncbi:uncharacterized protein LOC116847185 isoform X3 [Odontomachus brunneus]|uniref:uncharacterized protein LOC116847185 isoform X3 n=1 Tax=Odontomachus brunneus TaxID=486640 RepID=UPI0013F18641|nr:uncharacterized protein LOC116847185 isoform X3 [Odontomachus brunneus]